MATTTARNKGKTDFVKDVLSKNPLANTTAVNEAWKSAGREGSISATLVNKQRAVLGLAGNLRAKNKPKTGASPTETTAYTGKKRGRKPKSAAVESVLRATPHTNGNKTGQPMISVALRGKAIGHHDSLEELEADIDRLLFKVMGIGGLAEIEDSLRQTRRLIYRSFAGK
jgi:hypothetical protein